MLHALVGGFIGIALGILGAAVTWNKNLGPHWYPVALMVLALPQSWLGAKLFLRGTLGFYICNALNTPSVFFRQA